LLIGLAFALYHIDVADAVAGSWWGWWVTMVVMTVIMTAMMRVMIGGVDI